MGLFDKVKNLFTEEVDEPEEKVVKKEIKKEVKKPKEEIKKEIFKQERTVEIAPARKETADFFEREFKEDIKPVEVERPKVETKSSNILFSDEAFSDLPSRREERSKPVKRDIYSEFTTRKYETKKEAPKKEEKKSFKPSPIISPVYGVLDKNYKKEEISSKVRENPYKSDVVTVDDVRNKAFGTLEDDLENTLINKTLVVKTETVEEPSFDIFEELETKNDKDVIKDEIEKQRQQISEINEIIKSNVSPENKKVTSRKIDNILEELDEIEEVIGKKNKKEENVEDIKEDNDFIEDEIIEEEPEVEHTKVKSTVVVEDNNDDLEEGDLFNLIDSMYEKRDE